MISIACRRYRSSLLYESLKHFIVRLPNALEHLRSLLTIFLALTMTLFGLNLSKTQQRNWSGLIGIENPVKIISLWWAE